METDLLRQHWQEARDRLREKLARTEGTTFKDMDDKDASAETTDELKARIAMYGEILGETKRGAA